MLIPNEGLAKHDLTNTDWQHVLSATEAMIGDLLRAVDGYPATLANHRRLGKMSPATYCLASKYLYTSQAKRR